MLLEHAWLAPLVKPAAILEADEDEEELAEGDETASVGSAGSRCSLDSDEKTVVRDKEVADWVKAAIERRRNGTMGNGAQKPALHAAPLDAMASPSHESTNCALVAPTELSETVTV
jgi:mitogen-activated protein kinase kinase